MGIDRDELEALALHTVSANNYYDLADNMDSMTDADLHDLIDCDGDYDKELALEEEVKANCKKPIDKTQA